MLARGDQHGSQPVTLRTLSAGGMIATFLSSDELVKVLPCCGKPNNAKCPGDRGNLALGYRVKPPAVGFGHWVPFEGVANFYW